MYVKVELFAGDVLKKYILFPNVAGLGEVVEVYVGWYVTYGAGVVELTLF